MADGPWVDGVGEGVGLGVIVGVGDGVTEGVTDGEGVGLEVGVVDGDGLGVIVGVGEGVVVDCPYAPLTTEVAMSLFIVPADPAVGYVR